jgi:hypothetical protein
MIGEAKASPKSAIWARLQWVNYPADGKAVLDGGKAVAPPRKAQSIAFGPSIQDGSCNWIVDN